MFTNFNTNLRPIRDQHGAYLADLPVDPMYFSHRHAVNNPRGVYTCWNCGTTIQRHEPHHRLRYEMTPGDWRNAFNLRECFRCTALLTAVLPTFTKVLFTFWDDQNDSAKTNTGTIPIEDAWGMLDRGELRRTIPVEKTADGTWYQLGEPHFIEFAGHRTRLLAKRDRLILDIRHFTAQGVGMERERQIVKAIDARLPLIQHTYDRLRCAERNSWGRA